MTNSLNVHSMTKLIECRFNRHCLWNLLYPFIAFLAFRIPNMGYLALPILGYYYYLVIIISNHSLR